MMYSLIEQVIWPEARHSQGAVTRSHVKYTRLQKRGMTYNDHDHDQPDGRLQVHVRIDNTISNISMTSPLHSLTLHEQIDDQLESLFNFLFES